MQPASRIIAALDAARPAASDYPPEACGFVARNGHGHLCYFPDRRADGVPLTGAALLVAEQGAPQ